METAEKKEQLLEVVQIIQKKYETIDKLTHNNFNLLLSGDVGTKETFHSFLMADLLNPSGSHGLGDIFLKLFFDELGLNEQLKNPEVYAEYPTDNGRRIDLVIEDNGKIILAIEMKIYSKDSENQLKDYYNFIKSKNKKSRLYYLTLFGNMAHHQSNQNIQYETISFKDDITRWINRCAKEVYGKGKIRESLFQYKDLLDKLTNTNSPMEEEIVEVLSKDKTAIETAALICINYEKAWARKEYHFWLNLFNKVFEEISDIWEDGDEIVYSNSNCKSVWFGEKKGVNSEEIEEDKSIEILQSIRFTNSNGTSFGISFKRKIKNSKFLYVVAIYRNGGSFWVGLEIKDKNNKYTGNKIKDFFGDYDFGLDGIDEYSIYKIYENLKFASKDNPEGTYELFDEDEYQEILSKLFKEVKNLIKDVDKKLESKLIS